MACFNVCGILKRLFGNRPKGKHNLIGSSVVSEAEPPYRSGMSEFSVRGSVSGGINGSPSQPYNRRLNTNPIVSTREAPRTYTTTAADPKVTQRRQHYPIHENQADSLNRHQGENHIHVQKKIAKGVSAGRGKVGGNTSMGTGAESKTGEEIGVDVEGITNKALTQLAVDFGSESLGCWVGVEANEVVGKESKETATSLPIDFGSESLGPGVGLGYVNAAGGGYHSGWGGYSNSGGVGRDGGGSGDSYSYGDSGGYSSGSYSYGGSGGYSGGSYSYGGSGGYSGGSYSYGGSGGYSGGSHSYGGSGGDTGGSYSYGDSGGDSGS